MNEENKPKPCWLKKSTKRTGENCSSTSSSKENSHSSTSYSLVRGTEVVLPIEADLLSLRIAMASEIPKAEQIKFKLQEPDGIDERRLVAQQNMELYQARTTRAYEKLSRPRSFKKGESVLVLRRPIVGRHHGSKFAPNWEGHFIIDQVYDGRANLLANADGEDFISNWVETHEEMNHLFA
ncbi:hypothetical protein LUZ61_018376 [Rhynchospora tenuis]|uniref:Uncharacterized protein n=1 Tax=Rhynchospora tenuis TaxID=198213 RepID=A0AAD5Z963_9POAL|nr:hypothetical protein LUZ61_018376 [Rhynchospora tenuis]